MRNAFLKILLIAFLCIQYTRGAPAFLRQIFTIGGGAAGDLAKVADGVSSASGVAGDLNTARNVAKVGDLRHATKLDDSLSIGSKATQAADLEKGLGAGKTADQLSKSRNILSVDYMKTMFGFGRAQADASADAARGAKGAEAVGESAKKPGGLGSMFAQSKEISAAKLKGATDALRSTLESSKAVVMPSVNRATTAAKNAPSVALKSTQARLGKVGQAINQQAQKAMSKARNLNRAAQGKQAPSIFEVIWNSGVGTVNQVVRKAGPQQSMTTKISQAFSTRVGKVLGPKLVDTWEVAKIRQAKNALLSVIH